MVGEHQVVLLAGGGQPGAGGLAEFQCPFRQLAAVQRLPGVADRPRIRVDAMHCNLEPIDERPPGQIRRNIPAAAAHIQDFGPCPVHQQRADAFQVVAPPARHHPVHQRELGVGAAQQHRIAIRAVHFLDGFRGPRQPEHHSLLDTVNSPVSTVSPGPKAMEHTRSPLSAAAESRIFLSTNSTVALDMFP